VLNLSSHRGGENDVKYYTISLTDIPGAIYPIFVLFKRNGQLTDRRYVHRMHSTSSKHWYASCGNWIFKTNLWLWTKWGIPKLAFEN